MKKEIAKDESAAERKPRFVDGERFHDIFFELQWVKIEKDVQKQVFIFPKNIGSVHFLFVIVYTVLETQK